MRDRHSKQVFMFPPQSGREQTNLMERNAFERNLIEWHSVKLFVLPRQGLHHVRSSSVPYLRLEPHFAIPSNYCKAEISVNADMSHSLLLQKSTSMPICHDRNKFQSLRWTKHDIISQKNDCVRRESNPRLVDGNDEFYH